MCGLTGVFAFTEGGRLALVGLRQASEALRHRGPDAGGLYLHGPVGLAHRRLSVIDLSSEANQPFTDAGGRYTIIFNGEILNYKQLRAKLEQGGIRFRTNADTEVLLQLYLQQGQDCLKKLRGFFAFAIYDAADESLFIARDRFGEKPLLYYKDAGKFLFGSEMSALLALGVPREVDYTSLLQYLQLSYVPAPASMLQGVKKLLPGHSLFIRKGRVQERSWYRLPFNAEKAANNPLPYKQQQVKLQQLMEQAVAERLVADVPVGAFLSGGIDSSVVVALAAGLNPQLKTFSVGFKDQPYFDETHYARLVAQKYKTDHTELLLRNHDLYEHLSGMLDALSEPFADSSALAMYALSRYAGGQVKAVLSGDGADELFGGYNKHWAEYKIAAGGITAGAVKQLGFLWEALPASRSGAWGNKVRQLQRFATGADMPAAARYWFWATWQTEMEAMALLLPEKQALTNRRLYNATKNRMLECFNAKPCTINNVLCADWQLVLANDMLPKADLMGMANGLEIRSPFLDHRLVKYAFSLPVASKIDAGIRKKILRETFRAVLPPELFKRPKKGFDIPLQSFLQTEGRSLLQEYLSDDFVVAQGIFDVQQTRNIRQGMNSFSVPSVQTKAWMLLVFQHWWKKYLKV
ncbi:asparagine synthase (glutamine-hydrolyzing) [Pontibacter sp. 172403-2]|uniref:asparagine synthase (glutamine-hydrolyzing) n=1 Tax=Pontibacter rufus TaxID=2791028 RepID=UPI0018AF94E5|nr:asparagine synthase (glutamine-hydrolyzing) [Pontibacter sp. 172403-2]MBF9252050.1 asparagine synthase (glutamine-hydrolyzing) [Pontibacter sp. 172403-2]